MVSRLKPLAMSALISHYKHFKKNFLFGRHTFQKLSPKILARKSIYADSFFNFSDNFNHDQYRFATKSDD